MVLARFAKPLSVKSSAGSIPVSSAKLKGGYMFSFIGTCIMTFIYTLFGFIFFTMIMIGMATIASMIAYFFKMWYYYEKN